MIVCYKKKEQTETKFVFEWKKARVGKNYLRAAIVGSIISAMMYHYCCFFREYELIVVHLLWAFPLGAVSFLILYAYAREVYSQDAFNTLMIFDNEIGQVVFIEDGSVKVHSQFSYSQIEKIKCQKEWSVNKHGNVTSISYYLDIVLKDKTVFRLISATDIEKLTWAYELNEFIDWSKGEISASREYKFPSKLEIIETDDKISLSYEPKVRAALVINGLLLIPYASFAFLTIMNEGFLGFLLNMFYVIVNFVAFFAIICPLIGTLIDFFANRNCRYELTICSKTFELIKKYDSGKINTILKCPIGGIKSVSCSFWPLYQCALSFTPVIQDTKGKVKTYKFLFGNIGRYDLMEMEQYCQYQIGRFSEKEIV